MFGESQRNRTVAPKAPAICDTINNGASVGRMPAKVSANLNDLLGLHCFVPGKRVPPTPIVLLSASERQSGVVLRCSPREKSVGDRRRWVSSPEDEAAPLGMPPTERVSTHREYISDECLARPLARKAWPGGGLKRCAGYPIPYLGISNSPSASCRRLWPNYGQKCCGHL
jgi:hypothetical protein